MSIVLSCGCGHDGRLGHGREDNLSVPTPIDFFIEKQLRVVNIVAGGYHSFVQCENAVYSFGDNNYGQLGLMDKSSLSRLKPTEVTFLGNGENIAQIACGAYHSMVVM